MSLKIDRMQLEIIINNDQARKSLRHLEEETRRLKKELRKVPEGSDEWNKINDRLKSIKQQHDGIIEKLGIEKLTIRELGQRQKELNAIMRNLDPSTKAYRDLEKQLVAVKTRQGQLRMQTQKTNSSIENLSRSFNKYFGVIAGGAASLTGLIMAGKRAVTTFAEFDDKVTDVIKTTGRTRDEVYAINEELKKIDTRTAQEELLDLAYVAGKLGITAKEEIEGFVRATDQISVALKRDLGGNTEEAVRQVGKLVDLFKIKDVYGIEESLLKVGSSINDLGMASTASEGSIVDFANRVAGIAPIAGVSIENVLGLGATLDSLAQTSETSATVYSMVLTGMAKKTSEFAKIAKMDITDFSNLLKTDANEAFIRVMEGLKGNDEALQGLVANLSELGLEGRRSTAVLGALANNTQKIREQQDLATAAFEKGTSITDEYNIKNESAQAILEKKRKALRNISVELGAKLLPILIGANSALEYFLKAVITIMQYLPKLAPAFVILTGYIIAYKASLIYAKVEMITNNLLMEQGIGLKIKDAVVLQALIIKEQLYTIWKGKGTIASKIATTAQWLWNAAVAANPIGALVTALTALYFAIKAYDKYNAESIRLEREKKIVLDKIEKANKKLETIYGNQAIAISQLSKFSKEQKLALYEQTKATIQQAEAELVLLEAEKKRIANENNKTTAWQKTKNFLLSIGNLYTMDIRNAKDAAENSAEAADEVGGSIDGLRAQIKALKLQSSDLFAQLDEVIEDGGGGGTSVKKNKYGQTFEEWKQQMQELEDMRRVLASTRPEQDAPTMTNKEAWGQNFRTDEEEIPETTGLELLQEMMNRQKEQLAEQRAEGKLTQQQYNEELENMEFAHLATMINLRRQLGMDTLDLEKKINQMRIQNQEKTEQELIEKQQRMVERFMEFTKIGSSAIEDFMAGNEDALLEGGKAMINFALDILKQQMQIAIAGATMQSLVQPDSIATFGISGLARAAVMVALIEGAFAVAKGAVSRIGKSRSDAYADGNYQDVTTKSGGRYRAQVVSPSHRSGLFSKPTYVPGFGLFGETAQPELVFNPRDTQAIMNAPGLVNAINATLGSTVPQYARGNAREIIRESSTTVDPTSIQIMAELRDELRKGIQAKLIASETYYRTHNEGADRLNDFKQKLP
ncbi:MAG: phage tail tape measure protein [Bacteroidales bacterium]|nr:phage tail tape measure protein [Bacteroidales bacterium]